MAICETTTANPTWHLTEVGCMSHGVVPRTIMLISLFRPSARCTVVVGVVTHLPLALGLFITVA